MVPGVELHGLVNLAVPQQRHGDGRRHLAAVVQDPLLLHCHAGLMVLSAAGAGLVVVELCLSGLACRNGAGGAAGGDGIAAAAALHHGVAHTRGQAGSGAALPMGEGEGGHAVRKGHVAVGAADAAVVQRDGKGKRLRGAGPAAGDGLGDRQAAGGRSWLFAFRVGHRDGDDPVFFIDHRLGVRDLVPRGDRVLHHGVLHTR